MDFLKRHRETLFVSIIGLVVFATLNVLMMMWHYELWTNPKVGFWSAFWNNFEVSGFDPYAYILISKWRPIYIISRHPLLSVMMWPLSELNGWLKEITGINCAIYIVAVLWTLLSTLSWLLLYKIIRKLVGLDLWNSLMLTALFFSFSHVFLITFICDHMALTLPLLLLAVYLGGKAIRENRTMPLWQSLPLLFISTGVTTTNCVKIAIADFFTRVGKSSWLGLVRHFALYLVPLGIMLGLYFYQESTTQEEERKSVENVVRKRAARDPAFAKYWKEYQELQNERKRTQLVKISFVTNTEYRIDRLPSLVENIFGEGLLMHDTYVLKDSNRQHRPVDLQYRNWWQYAVEAVVVLLFLFGLWAGRRDKILLTVAGMFLFDMLLHVGLNFASSDVYIMTAHWAFVIPIAYAFALKATKDKPQCNFALRCVILFLMIYMLANNVPLIANYFMIGS